MKFRVIVAAPK